MWRWELRNNGEAEQKGFVAGDQELQQHKIHNKKQRDQWTPSGYPFLVVLKVDQWLQRVKIIYKIEYCLDLCILQQKVALVFFKSSLKTHKKKLKKKLEKRKRGNTFK